jgi:hypothetical protein
MARKTDYGIWDDERKPTAWLRSDGKWECIAKASAEYVTQSGRPKTFHRTGATKQEAEKKDWIARNKYEREQRLGLSNKVDKAKTLKQYMEEHLKERRKHAIRYGGKSWAILSDQTYFQYTQHPNSCFYKSQFGNLQLSMITMPRVINFLNLICKNHNKSTLQNTTVCLNTLFAELYYK